MLVRYNAGAWAHQANAVPAWEGARDQYRMTPTFTATPILPKTANRHLLTLPVNSSSLSHHASADCIHSEFRGRGCDPVGRTGLV